MTYIISIQYFTGLVETSAKEEGHFGYSAPISADKRIFNQPNANIYKVGEFTIAHLKDFPHARHQVIKIYTADLKLLKDFENIYEMLKGEDAISDKEVEEHILAACEIAKLKIEIQRG